MKRVYILFLILTAIVTVTFAQEVNLEDGLVAYYPFNGNANDESGNGNHGTVNGASLTTDRFGNENSAYNFNGITDEVIINSSTHPLGNPDVTYSCWLYSTNYQSTYKSIIDVGITGVDNKRLFLHITNLNYCRFGSHANAFDFAETIIPFNQWNHILVSKTGNTLKLYLNGSYCSEGNVLDGINIDNSKISIGSNGTDWEDGEHFEGLIDDVRIYNRSLNEDEIQALYTEGQTVNLEDGLVAYYPFNGNANDESGNGNHGTVNGAILTTDRLGNESSAYNFDGVDDFIEINNTLGNFGTNDFTISCWIISISNSNEETFIGKREACSAGTYWYGNINGLRECDWYTFDGTPANSSLASTSLLNTISWYHIIFMREGINCKIFINGVEDNSNTTEGIPNIINSAPLTFGARYCDSSPLGFFTGLIDDIRIYNRALNEEEVQALYTEGGWSSLNQGLVAYYPFNGNADDESGNALNGTVNGATLTTDRFGNSNSAYHFDGVDDFIEIENSSSSLSFESNPFTISFWFITSEIHQGIIFSKERAGVVPNQLRIGFEWDSLAYFFAGTNSDGFALTTLSDDESITPSRWIHVLITRENLTNNIYINGSLFKSTVSDVVINHSNELNVRFGTRYALSGNDGINFLNGKIDDVRLYNRALNEDEIQALYEEGKYPMIFTNNQTATVGRIIEVPILTSELTSGDNVIAYQFDFNYDNTKLEYISSTIEGTLAEGGVLEVNSMENKLSIGWASADPLVGEGEIVKLFFKSIEGGETTPTITNALFNTATINASTATISANYLYGDIDANDFVQAYDAALALQFSVSLDPLPEIDPIPWENWRDSTANVDGVDGITANDASLILQYSVGLIDIFPVEDAKNSSAKTSGDVNLTFEEGNIVFRSSGELFGLNVFVYENFAALGEPEVLVNEVMKATNITETNYAIGLATAASPEEGTAFMNIPVVDNQVGSITFDLIVNTSVKTVTVSIATGLITIHNSDVFLYPNPVHSELTVGDVKPNSIINIYDLTGKLLVSKKTYSVTEKIDVSGLSTGIYTIRIETDGVGRVARFVKQ